MFCLVIVTLEGGIEISHHKSKQAAEDAFMRDLYETYQDTNLPCICSEEEIAAWAKEYDIDLDWKIEEVELL